LIDALPLGRLHIFVHYLAKRFATKVLASEARLSAISSRPTLSEICRFERALYRFEIYCNFFRSSLAPSRREERRELYFSKFSPCENEQLDCIHGFLIREIAPGMLQ
jgi:hypothetical protein